MNVSCEINYRVNIFFATERLSALLPEETKQQAVNWLPRKESFELAYKFDCRSLFVDFKEDLEFRFSFGISALMQRFLGPKKTRMMMSGISEVCKIMF